LTHEQVNTLKRSTSKKSNKASKGKSKSAVKTTVRSRTLPVLKGSSDLQLGGLNRELLRTFTEFMREEGLASFSFKSKDFEVDLKFASANEHVVSTLPVPQPVQHFAQQRTHEVRNSDSGSESKSPAVNPNAQVIKSPFVGTFYRAPAPGKPSFVEVGAVVKAGDALCVLEAMKLMNEIEAEFKCKILRVLVEDASPVEYGEALFEVEAL
jgi:acetyl-CoA carboxylase biotin carboxyl carrier protein